MIKLLKAINLILGSIMFLYYKYLVWRSKKMKIKRYTGKKFAYYQCEVCGRQIDSLEYYTYGKCYLCR